MPNTQYDRAPTYYVVGGLVFQPLTLNYLNIWGEQKDVPTNLANYYYYGRRSKNRKQVIVLTKILGDEINANYGDFIYKVITQVNGREISSMEDLVRAIEFNEGRFQDMR